MLTEIAERALALTQKKEVLLVGGVAQNKRLTEMLKQMSTEHNAKFFVPKPDYNADNGLMIAVTGMRMAKAGVKHSIRKLGIRPRWRTDEVKVSW